MIDQLLRTFRERGTGWYPILALVPVPVPGPLAILHNWGAPSTVNVAISPSSASDTPGGGEQAGRQATFNFSRALWKKCQKSAEQF